MIAVSSSGKSFRALAAYLAKGRTGKEEERVAWTASRNLPTSDPELAAVFMRSTASQSDRIEKPVYHVVLSFDPADAVEQSAMEHVADRVLARLGLAEYQAVIVAHRDRAHSHLHLLVNRVHPETGKAWERWKDQHVIQQVLREEERSLGLRQVPGRLASPQLELTPNSDRLPGGAESQSSGFLRRLARDLAAYEHVVQAGRKQFQTDMAATAARAQAAEVQIATQRASKAQQGFTQALGVMYAAPQQAEEAFREAAEREGLASAARSMRAHPETFGSLRTSVRIRFGFARGVDDQAARAGAPIAAQRGREVVEAERAVGVLPPTGMASDQVGFDADSGRHSSEEREHLQRRGDLELRIVRSIDRLAPREFTRLKALLTSPQAALAERLRSTARDVLLGRQEERGA